MRLYSVKCATCGRSEPHGSVQPINADSCNAARALRAACREVSCRFAVAESEYEPTPIDQLRLGMREERAIA